MKFETQNYDASGGLKTSLPAIPASLITSGQVAVARGGTGADLSASTGDLIVTAGTVTANTKTGTGDSVRATSPSLTTPAIAGATLTGAIDANAATMRAPVTASALTTTEGYWKWDSTDKIAKYYDGTRERGASGWGYQPAAWPFGYSPAAATTQTVTLAANGGTVVAFVQVIGHMLLRSVTVRNLDTTLARSWRWDLYADINNSSNSVTRVATSSGSDAFTASAASNRTLAASGAPVYLPPGAYIIAIQCDHASNSFGVAAQSITTLGSGYYLKTKTTTNPNGSTLNIIAATWTVVQNVLGAGLLGSVANDTVVW